MTTLIQILIAQIRKQPILSLLLVPLVAIFMGSRWEAYRSWEPEKVEYVVFDAGQAGVAAGASRSLERKEEGASSFEGVVFRKDQGLQVTLPFAMSIGFVDMQADANDAYVVLGSTDAVQFEEIGRVPRHELYNRGGFLHTRRGSLAHGGRSYRFLRILPMGEDGHYSVAAMAVIYKTASAAHAVWVPVAIWAVWVACLLFRRRSGSSGRATAFLKYWVGLEGFLSAVLVYSILFREDFKSLYSYATLLLLALVLVVLRIYLNRFSGARLAGLVGMAVLLSAFHLAASRLVEVKLSKKFDLSSVDHRLQPDGNEINQDSLRFRGDAEGLDDDEFVVIFMGDSFTFGSYLDYHESYPYVFEELLKSRGCTQKVRSVNFGWPTSSPLLGLRLLREVGKNYRPDLVIYNLDMTDFYDDLHYGEMLRQAGEVAEFLVPSIWTKILLIGPWKGATQDWMSWASRHRRSRAEETSAESLADVLTGPVFFATSQPLDKSRRWIEQGVGANLNRIHRFSRDELGAPMVLAILVRAFQHSRVESPRNWERVFYEVMGPYAREPFHYFEQNEQDLEYPYFSMLPAFEHAEEFPLYLPDDPHWTPTGSRVAAQAALDALLQRGLLPCPASTVDDSEASP